MAENKPSLLIAMEKWDTLSDNEKATLRALGLKPDAPSVREVNRAKAYAENLEEYVLGVILDCRCCDSRWTELWQMIPTLDEVEPYARGGRIAEGNGAVADKIMLQKRLTCRHCEKALMERSKEDLVNIIISRTQYAILWKRGKKKRL